MASEKRSTDVTEPTPNVDSPVKKKVKTDVTDEEVEPLNGHPETVVVTANVDAEAAAAPESVPVVQVEAATEEPEPEPMAIEENSKDVDADVDVVDADADANGTETKADEAPDAEASAEKWTPPPFGSVCWIQIPAADVARGKQFYKSAFDFDFKPNPAGYKDENIAMFTLAHPGGSLAGGICKTNEFSAPSGGTILYFMVEDVDKALEKIESLGGKTREAKKPEGEHGLMGLFEDTEGNVHGVYQLKPAAAAASEEAKE